MMYDREHAPGELKLRFHIRNKRGEDILGALRYDPSTGQGFRRDMYGKETEFFVGGGYVEIDGHSNPIREELEAIYASARSHLSTEVRDATVKKVIDDARAETEQQQREKQ
jgi:hypothetical protein